jgi:copper resistance protein B
VKLFLSLLLLSFSSWAQDSSNPIVVEGMDKYDLGKSQFNMMTVNDNPFFGFLFVDRLEERFKSDDDSLLWDTVGRFGNQYHRIFIESEGVYNTSKGNIEDSRNEILYGYSYAPYWDIQAGYRRDFFSKKNDRDFGVLSVLGLAPFDFEVDAAAYVSTKGDISTLLEFEYSFLLTQRTQLIPRLEIAASIQEVKEYNIGSGLNGFEAGLRLSHQFVREFAPYIGISWEKKTFGTKDFVEDAGEDSNAGLLVVGARIII